MRLVFLLFLNLSVLFAKEVLLVTVSDDRFGRKGGVYEKTQNKIEMLFKNNPQYGITKYSMVKVRDLIGSNFYNENKLFLEEGDPDRNGRIYKPYAIYQGLEAIEDGDFLIYSDCSPEMWNNFDENAKLTSEYNVEILKKLCQKNGDILTAYVYAYIPERPTTRALGDHTHANFTLDRCILKMDLWKYRESLMHASGMVILRKSPRSVEFVKEWLYWNCIDECASVGFIHIPYDKTFRNEEYDVVKAGHRCDQSISGLLVNRLNNQLIFPPKDLRGGSAYNFLLYSQKNMRYKFINSNITNPDFN